MNRPGFRYVNETVGALVLVALLLFIGSVLQAGVLREWFDPPLTLRVELPADGVAGLAAGAEVEILGTRAGVVRRIVIEPNQKMFALIALNPSMRTFVGRDSQGIIRRRFGIAGAAYLEITRDQKKQDWELAVISAVAERAPTESVGQLIDEVRTKVFPIVEDTHRAIRTVATIVEKVNDPRGDVQAMIRDVRELTRRVEQGEGAVGRLLNDDTLVRELEVTILETNERLRQAKTLLADLEATTRLLRTRAERTLTNVQAITTDLAKTTPQLPAIARNVEATTANLPQLLIQTQQTTLELEKLLSQLRGHWLLGGGPGEVPEPVRQPAREVRP